MIIFNDYCYDLYDFVWHKTHVYRSNHQFVESGYPAKKIKSRDPCIGIEFQYDEKMNNLYRGIIIYQEVKDTLVRCINGLSPEESIDFLPPVDTHSTVDNFVSHVS